jgi:hypothetical protein
MVDRMPEISAAKWLILIIAVAVIAHFASTKLPAQTLSSAAAKPFIAYQIERSFSGADHDHSNPAITPSMFARRNDGSEVHSFTTTAPDGSEVETREVTDIRRGRYFILNNSAKTVTTFYNEPADLYKGVKNSQVCPVEAHDPSAQKTTLLGHPVVLLRNVVPGMLTEDVKAALDLDCYPLHVLQTFDSGSVNETEVTSIAATEPPERFFDVPTEYREISPSQVNAEYAQKYPGHSLWSGAFLQVLDRRYYSHR